MDENSVFLSAPYDAMSSIPPTHLFYEGEEEKRSTLCNRKCQTEWKAIFFSN